MNHPPNIAVLIPCYNEEQTVAGVVEDFKRELPHADIFVYDNASSDETSRVAKEAGAIVRYEPKRGKGNVVRSMFRDIEADIYIMTDGDMTYPAKHVHELIKHVTTKGANMVVGDRLSQTYDEQNDRRFHSFGNRLVRTLVNRLFGAQLSDIMSGLRVFDRTFVKTYPVTCQAFELETDMTIHALQHRFNIAEVPITYLSRPEGSDSKLNTFRDGFRVLKTIFAIFKNHKPMPFFLGFAALFGLLGLAIGALPIADYVRFAYVYRVPSAILAAGLELMAMLSLCCGLILDTIAKNQMASYELYLNEYQDRAIVREWTQSPASSKANN